MFHELLAGRNKTQLSDNEIRRAVSTFLGLDKKAPVRYEQGARTSFWPPTADNSDAEIVFGEDFYPGTGVVDPNSYMGVQAAAAHELSHYYRWMDKKALDGEALQYLDEALTSLDAIARFADQLSQLDIRQLASDAAMRLQLHVTQLAEKA